MNKILGVDVDGVLTNSLESYLPSNVKEKFRKIYASFISNDNINSKGKVVMKLIKSYFNHKWSKWEKIKLIDADIPSYLDKLSKKYEIIIITATFGDVENVKKWLKLNKINYPLIKVPASEKWKYCNIMIDDRIDVLNKFGHGQTKILFSKDKNEKIENGFVFSNWKEMKDFLLKY